MGAGFNWLCKLQLVRKRRVVGRMAKRAAARLFRPQRKLAGDGITGKVRAEYEEYEPSSQNVKHQVWPLGLAQSDTDRNPAGPFNRLLETQAAAHARSEQADTRRFQFRPGPERPNGRPIDRSLNGFG